MPTTSIAPIAEGITAGQIGRAADRFSERCRVNASSLPKDTVQTVLEDEGDALAQEMFEVFRSRIKRHANTITRRVTVNRTRTPQEALDATGRTQYTDRTVVDSMPREDLSGQEGDEVEVVFFKLDLSERGGHISDDGLEKEYESRGLTPADPISVAAVNEADLTFADEHPNATHWKNADNKWCYASFYLWNYDRKVYVYRGGFDWFGDGWFAGVRK